jgi:hypothetical protein
MDGASITMSAAAAYMTASKASVQNYLRVPLSVQADSKEQNVFRKGLKTFKYSREKGLKELPYISASTINN